MCAYILENFQSTFRRPRPSRLYLFFRLELAQFKQHCISYTIRASQIATIIGVFKKRITLLFGQSERVIVRLLYVEKRRVKCWHVRSITDNRNNPTELPEYTARIEVFFSVSLVGCTITGFFHRFDCGLLSSVIIYFIEVSIRYRIIRVFVREFYSRLYGSLCKNK